MSVLALSEAAFWLLPLLWVGLAFAGPGIAAGIVLANRNVWLVCTIAVIVLALALAATPFFALTWAILCALG